jgi:hypothetical protein
VKERLLHSATKAVAATTASPIALGSPFPTVAAPLGILAHFASKGNPFKAAAVASAQQQQQQQQQPDAALLVFDATTITAPAVAPLPSPGGVSASGIGSSSRPKPPVSWAITQAALNGLARFAGKYLQLMRLCPSLALEAYTALVQLLDLYVYAVCAFFVPEQSLQLFLGNGAHLNAEGSVVEELNWANQEVYVPLPCELEELAGLRTYLTKVRADLIEADNWEALATEAASKLKKLGADTAKKFGAFAAGQAALNTMNTMRMGARAPSPPAPSSASSGVASRGASPSLPMPPPIVTGGLVRSGGPSPTPMAAQHEGEEDGEEDGEDEEAGAEEGEKPKKKGSGQGAKGTGPKRLVKRVKVQKPVFVAEALEDPDALFGLSQRAVAVESCAFLLELLRHLLPHALALLPRKAAFLHGNRGACETYLDTVGEAVAQLRTLVLRAAAPQLVGAAGVAAAVEGQAWTAGGTIREEANAYTEELCGQCAALWAKVGPQAQAQQAGGGGGGFGGLDSTYIPPQCQLPIWTEACQAAMAALLEGFARVEACAPEGRALMSMDLQAVQSGLDAIQKVRPGRGRVHVDNYVKAYY